MYSPSFEWVVRKWHMEHKDSFFLNEVILLLVTNKTIVFCLKYYIYPTSYKIHIAFLIVSLTNFIDLFPCWRIKKLNHKKNFKNFIINGWFEPGRFIEMKYASTFATLALNSTELLRRYIKLLSLVVKKEYNFSNVWCIWTG